MVALYTRREKERKALFLPFFSAKTFVIASSANELVEAGKERKKRKRRLIMLNDDATVLFIIVLSLSSSHGRQI